MSLTRRIALPGSSSQRRWLFLAFVVLSVAAVLFALTRPTPEPAPEPGPALSTAPTPQSSAASSTGPQSEALTTAPPPSKDPTGMARLAQRTSASWHRRLRQLSIRGTRVGLRTPRCTPASATGGKCSLTGPTLWPCLSRSSKRLGSMPEPISIWPGRRRTVRQGWNPSCVTVSLPRCESDRRPGRVSTCARSLFMC
jgi:hypothetical protein